MLQVVELSNPRVNLRKRRGHLEVITEEGRIHKLPFHQLAAVLVTGPEVSLTKQVMLSLMEANIPLVLCGENYHPTGLMVPYAQHHRTVEVLKLQIETSQPLRKRLWQTIVQGKIRNQAEVLYQIGAPEADKLSHLADKVLSGDTTNQEGVAAAIYFRQLFEPDFVRDRHTYGVNSFLNYGYAIVRAIIARAVVGSGLQPALGLGHTNLRNPYCLVDDLMEPFRPLVDRLVFDGVMTQGWNKEEGRLTPKIKEVLVGSIYTDLAWGTVVSPAVTAVMQLCYDLIESFRQKRNLLTIPTIP